MSKFIGFALFFLLTINANSYEQNIDLNNALIVQDNLLAENSRKNLSGILQKYNQSTNKAIQFLIIHSTGPQTIEEFSTEIIRNSPLTPEVIVVIDDDNRKIRIHPSSNNREIFNDQTNYSIINLATPYLEENNYEFALNIIFSNISGLLNQSFNFSKQTQESVKEIPEQTKIAPLKGKMKVAHNYYLKIKNKIEDNYIVPITLIVFTLIALFTLGLQPAKKSYYISHTGPNETKGKNKKTGPQNIAQDGEQEKSVQVGYTWS